MGGNSNSSSSGRTSAVMGAPARNQSGMLKVDVRLYHGEEIRFDRDLHDYSAKTTCSTALRPQHVLVCICIWQSCRAASGHSQSTRSRPTCIR